MFNLKIIIFPILLVLSIIFIWLIVKPIYDEGGDLNRVKKPSLESTIRQEEDLKQRVEKLVGGDGNDEQSDIILKALPDSKQTKNLIAQLEFIVNKEKMTLASIAVNDIVPADQTIAGIINQAGGKTFKEVSGNFEVRGSYGQFKQLLRDVRKLDRLVNIEEISIANTSGEDGGVIGKYAIGFKAYWQPAITEEQAKVGLESVSVTPSMLSVSAATGVPQTTTP